MNSFQRWYRSLPSPLQRHKLIKVLIKIFPSLRQTEFYFNGNSKCIVDLKDGWARQFFKQGEYGQDFIEIVSPLIPAGGVYFDVGANFGWCTFGLFGARPYDRIRYFMFEANPAILGCLEKSIALNAPGEFHLIHGCVLNTPGYSSFEFSTEHTGGSHYTGSSGQGIPNILLDQFIPEQGVGSVDLMKMDIEGAELMALEGASESLAKGVIKAIFLEISTDNLRRQGRQPEDLISFLRNYGFNLFWCRRSDFDTFPELRQSFVTIKSGLGSLRVSPLENYPQNYQTDVLALHRDTPLSVKIRDQLQSKVSAQRGAYEVAI